MFSDASERVGDIAPHTYEDRHGVAREVVHIPVRSAEVGKEAGYPPPNFAVTDFASWMRQQYFIFEERVTAQVPRKSGVYPIETTDGQLVDIFHNSQDRQLLFYYSEEEELLRVHWEYGVDTWGVETVDSGLSEGEVTVPCEEYDRIWNWKSR
jgi:hypothetical protein